MNIFIQKQKEKVFRDCLSQGATLVVFVTNAPGVIVPDDVKESSPLRGLNFSQRFANGISWDKEAIHQRLTFDTYTFDVTVPWSAIMSITSRDKKINQLWKYEED